MELADLISAIWRGGQLRPRETTAMQATTEHSAGPWRQARESLYTEHEQGLRIVDARGNLVGTATRGPVKLNRPQAEWEANARLMAAAPTLLGLCEEAISCLGGVGSPATLEARLQEAVAEVKGG